MKRFDQFIKEEADIKGNPGIPGEGEKKPGEPNYLKNVEQRAKQRLGITDRDMGIQTPMGRMPSQKESQLGREIMQLLPQSINLVSGNEEELSKLATDIIYDIYKDIIDRYEIELDIKLVKPGKIKDFMDECDECDPDMKEEREIKDTNLIKEIHKRKITNLIIQGEAKNTKHILHSEEIKNGLVEILGEQKGKELFNVLDRITKIADQLDWIIPEQFRAQMMEEVPDGIAGACSVGWKPKEKEESQDEEEYKEFTGEEDDEEYTEDDDTSSENFSDTPILRARGVDLSMLLHESVKGLFEILSIAGLPKGETEEETREMLNKIYANTGLSDEPQDWKYGPEVAADLRDFVNENNKVDLYPNVREELWKIMVDRETLKTDDFLSLMRGILAKTEEARKKVDHLIDKVIEMIKVEKEELDRYNKDMEDYERKMKDYEEEKNNPEVTEEEPESDIDKLVKKSLYGEKEEEEKPEEVDYSTWSQRELQDEIDAALDAGDYKRVSMLSQYMKEGREIYMRELEIINEKLNPHTK